MIDYSKLKNLEVGDGYIVGELNGRASLPYLKENELCGRFEGVNTLIDWLDVQKRERHGSNSSSKGRDEFHRFESYEKAMDVFKNDPSSIADFDESDDMVHSGESSGNSVEYDLTGDFIDIGRFVEGIPEVFGNMVDGNPRGERIKILVNGMFSHHVHHDLINKRALRIKRLVDWLENNGIRSEITVLFSNDNWHCEVVVKKFDEIFDINQVAISSNPDFFRRAQFRFAEFSKTLNSWNYGSPVDFWRYFNKENHRSEYNQEYSLVIGGNTDSYNIDTEFDRIEKDIMKAIEDDVNDKVFVAMEGYS